MRLWTIEDRVWVVDLLKSRLVECVHKEREHRIEESQVLNCQTERSLTDVGLLLTMLDGVGFLNDL